MQADQEILNSAIIYPNVAIAISKHETANWKSKLYVNHHNAFGFRGKKGYKHYKNLQASIQDYERYEARVIVKHNPESEEEYLKIISRTYAKSPMWLKRVKHNLRYGVSPH